MRANLLRTNEGHQADISRRRALCSPADLNTHYANGKKEDRGAKIKAAQHQRKKSRESKVCKGCGQLKMMGSKNRCKSCRRAKPGLCQMKRIAPPAAPRPLPALTTTHLDPKNWHTKQIICVCGQSVLFTFWMFLRCLQWKTVTCSCGRKVVADFQSRK